MTGLRTLPPSGTPIPPGLLLRWAARVPRPTGADDDLRDLLRHRYGVEEVFLLSSGRAAMTVLLGELSSLAPERDEVVVPGYTCYSVAASAARGGLRVRPIDVEPGTLDYRHDLLEELDTEKVLAVVSANLFGAPNDLPRLESFARERGIFLVDDAAQALHARVGGRWAGTFGDAGIFSFDKGKNVSTVQGGVLLAPNPEVAARIRRRVEGLGRPSSSREFSDIVKLGLYALLLHPRAYWLPDRLLPLGGTPWETDYPVERYSSRLAPMALQLLRGIEEITAERVRRGGAIRDALPPSSRYILPRPAAGESVELRVPVVLRDAGLRDRVLGALRAEGLGATPFYPRALADVPEVRPHLAPGCGETPGARGVAAGMLTLPTHRFVSDRDVERMAAVVEAVLEEGGGG